MVILYQQDGSVCWLEATRQPRQSDFKRRLRELSANQQLSQNKRRLSFLVTQHPALCASAVPLRHTGKGLSALGG